MPWKRWTLILVAAWACCMAWGADNTGLLQGSDRFTMYLTTLGIIGVLGLTFEVGDWIRGKFKAEPEKSSEIASE
jgi:hypothetical protein